MYASIDIGTNAVLLLMVDFTEGVREILDVSTITRLGEGLIKSRELCPSAMRRTLEALERYAGITTEYNADRVICYGTSALREARNSHRFIELAESRLGWKIKVLNTYQEAYYTFLSVREDPAMPGDGWLIVDIGGGSTEVIEGTRESFEGYVSLPVGTVKLTDGFVKHDPPLEQEINGLIESVRPVLTFSCRPRQTIIGMAGTMTTLGAMIKGIPFDKEAIHGMEIPASTVDVWIERMRTMTIAERRLLPGMEPGREDLLFQGLILMRQIMEYCDSSRLIVNTHGARYGVLYETIKAA